MIDIFATLLSASLFAPPSINVLPQIDGQDALVTSQTLFENLNLPADQDWIQLKSGEIVYGTIEELLYECMRFKSDDLGTLSIKLDKIARFYTPRNMAVLVMGVGSYKGSIAYDSGKMSVNDSVPFAVNPAMIVTIHEIKPSEVDRWENKITFGANFAKGNSENTEISGKFSGTRTTYLSRTSINYSGVLTESEGETTARNHRLSSSYDIFRHARQVIRPIQVDLYHAPLQNIALQAKVSSQLGYEVVDTSNQSWELFAGPSWQFTQFEDVAEGLADSESSLGATFSSVYEYEMTDSVDLKHSYELTIANQRTGGLLHRNLLAFNVELTNTIDLDIDFVWDRTENPTPDSTGNVPEKDDYRLTFGIGVEL
uniref:DUF481 domain-containing protein n=1 Tax=Thaumasiovibrio occultus TaxID=1891184 RepID=UPI000B362215|nr:DUF481 domain-containing protein [Thaumasiovibrio occultus]